MDLDTIEATMSNYLLLIGDVNVNLDTPSEAANLARLHWNRPEVARTGSSELKLILKSYGELYDICNIWHVDANCPPTGD